MQRFNLEQIREYWTEQARMHGQSPGASWSDQMVIDLEIREIVPYLDDGDHVLDAGCANGYSTVQFAAQKRASFRGVDYIPEMIEQGRKRLEGLAGRLQGTVQFAVGDIAALAEPAAAFDKLIVIRVLINLASRERQLVALRECARVLKPGGMLLLSEATMQGWARLNEFRREWGLPDIPMPAFNLYLDQEEIVRAAADEFELVRVADFASTYYVGTRVLKPLLAQALASSVDVANPLMHWNRWCAALPPAGDYGTQKLFVFRKR